MPHAIGALHFQALIERVYIQVQGLCSNSELDKPLQEQVRTSVKHETLTHKKVVTLYLVEKLLQLPTSPYSDPTLPASSRLFSACPASALCLGVLALSGWPSGRPAAWQPQNLRECRVACVSELLQRQVVLG